MAGHLARPVVEATNQAIPRFTRVSHKRPLEAGLDATLKPPTRTQAPVPPPGRSVPVREMDAFSDSQPQRPPGARDTRAHLDAAVVHA